MEARQRTLFETQYTLHPTDSHVEPQDTGRLAGQNAEILARLRQGPATNDELIAISRKYTSRISDLRKAGFTITASRLTGGLFVYTLEG